MRICFLTPRFPYPPIKGDKLRVFHQLQALSREHDIALLSLAESPPSAEERAQVERLCEQVIIVPLPRWRRVVNLATGVVYGRQPGQVRYYNTPALQPQLDGLLASERFDVVHVSLIRMLPYVWGLRNQPVVVDLIDSLALNLDARREQVAGPLRIAYNLEYRRVRAYEQAVVGRFSALVVSSPADAERLGDGGHVTVIPNGVDLERFSFRGAEGRDEATLVFTGNLGYHPNEEAVLWFVREVWPLVRSKHPRARLQIVGANPGRQMRSLEREGVEIAGQVPDVASYLRRATIAICPMRSGSGIQNKVLEAMACGAPVVASSIANRGVQAVAERDLLVADSPRAFADSITRLLADRTLRARLGRAARSLVEQRFRWEQHAQRLSEIYASFQRAAA